jgi:hypothetical protein
LVLEEEKQKVSSASRWVRNKNHLPESVVGCCVVATTNDGRGIGLLLYDSTSKFKMSVIFGSGLGTRFRRNGNGALL